LEVVTSLLGNGDFKSKRSLEVPMVAASTSKLSAQERDALASQYAGLVKHIASRMSVMLPAHIEMEDLIHDGVIGLMDALNRFDPSKGVKFQTYAANRIRGAMLDALRSLDWVSRGARRRARELHVAEQTLSQSIGRQPSLDELTSHSGLSRTEVWRRQQERDLGFLASLDEVRSTSDDFEERLGDTLRDPHADVEGAALKSSRREALLRGLKSLSEREQLILSLYYFEDLNIREIGTILGVSEARISQLHSRCMRKLREILGQGELGMVS
jgi:RNA polymerase sigma factor for flagellar operon FliA